jgi:hypothetical protein
LTASPFGSPLTHTFKLKQFLHDTKTLTGPKILVSVPFVTLPPFVTLHDEIDDLTFLAVADELTGVSEERNRKIRHFGPEGDLKRFIVQVFRNSLIPVDNNPSDVSNRKPIPPSFATWFTSSCFHLSKRPLRQKTDRTRARHEMAGSLKENAE